MEGGWRDSVSPEKAIILDSSASAYIAPKKIYSDRRHAPKNHITEPPRQVSTHDAPNRGTTPRRRHRRSKTKAFTWRQQPRREGEMPTHLNDASKKGNDTHRRRRCQHQPKKGRILTSPISNPPHRIEATLSMLGHSAAATAPRRDRNVAEHRPNTAEGTQPIIHLPHGRGNRSSGPSNTSSPAMDAGTTRNSHTNQHADGHAAAAA